MVLMFRREVVLLDEDSRCEYVWLPACQIACNHTWLFVKYTPEFVQTKISQNLKIDLPVTSGTVNFLTHLCLPWYRNRARGEFPIEFFISVVNMNPFD